MPGDTGSFIRDHVFPDTELVHIGDMLQFAEARAGKSAMSKVCANITHKHCATGSIASKRGMTRPCAHVDECTYRVWRLYMAGCAHNFDVGRLGIYQTLLAKLADDGNFARAHPRGASGINDAAFCTGIAPVLIYCTNWLSVLKER